MSDVDVREELRGEDWTEGFEVLTRDFVADVVSALEAEDWARLRDLTDPLHAADMADLLGLVSHDQRRRLVGALEASLDPAMLIELEEDVRDEVLDVLDPQTIAAAVSQLDTGDAVYLLEDVEEEKREAVLRNVPAPARIAVRDSLAYPEDSAGRLLQRDLVAVPPYWTVGHTIDYLRENIDIPEEFHTIFVVDPRFHPIGTVSLDRLLRNRRPTLLKDLMEAKPRLIPVDMDQEEVAYQFQQYRLVSAAVVDEEERLLGVITIDDVVDVINEEAEEDIFRLSGVQDDLYVPILETVRRRFTWLFVNLLTAVLASVVISLFDATLEAMVALAILMPIVASMGGNAGTQTLTIAVRALATRELTVTNAVRATGKELMVGAINGVLLAIIIGVAGGVWFGNIELGLVLAAAMVVNLVVAALSGILVPLGLAKVGVDPAVASSVFVTTVTDVVGFFIFLGLAGIVLF